MSVVRAALVTVLILTKCLSLVNAHIMLYVEQNHLLHGAHDLSSLNRAHPSSWGFNVTQETPTAYAGDNRPCVPLYNRTFHEWWFHGFLDYPPHPQDVFQLEAGKTAVVETVCNKDASSYWRTGDNVFTQTGDMNSPCPGSPMKQYRKGCALSIVYESDVSKIKPEDFTVFSIQQTCVWHRFTHFDVPAAMPPCPHNRTCICQWNWHHLASSGSEQMYSNMFRCNTTGTNSTKPIAKPKVPRRCGGDPDNHIPPDPSNCTWGAKQPFYWLQRERNNMFEGYYDVPTYNDRYNFKQGAQNDIFEDGPSTPHTTETKGRSTHTPSTGTATTQTEGKPTHSPTHTPSTETTTTKTKGKPTHTPSTGTTTTKKKGKPTHSPSTGTTTKETKGKPTHSPSTRTKKKGRPTHSPSTGTATKETKGKPTHTRKKGEPGHSPSTATEHTPTSHCKHRHTQSPEVSGRPGANAAHRKLIRKH
ncbi:uncharacterized protein EI90DRAFT_3043471, partial [Cantharellus anzutake]|uniref:uncharacterized protein n=1 Tax=Cantharellus anzutake TaxID=1750568 RepID=UPI001906D491